MIKQFYTLDIKNNTTYPKIVDKQETEGTIRLTLEFEDGRSFFADVISFNIKGIYKVKIIEKV